MGGAWETENGDTAATCDAEFGADVTRGRSFPVFLRGELERNGLRLGNGKRGHRCYM
jgi:hypothetical protein